MILMVFDYRVVCFRILATVRGIFSHLMSSSNKSLSSGYFERLYARNSDPWLFASSEYEHRKYAVTLARLKVDDLEARSK